MNQCTFFSRHDDPAGILALAAELLRTPATTEGTQENWSVAVFAANDWTLRVNRNPPRVPGDRSSKIILGLVNWLERVATRNPVVTPIAVKRIFQTASILGLTGTPELSSPTGDLDYLFELADRVDALVWTGNALFTPGGDLLIDAAGETELASEAPK